MTLETKTIGAMLVSALVVCGVAVRLGSAERAEARAGDVQTREEQRLARVARGKYLVATSACTDCHTPMKLGPNGPEPDLSRMLSGHPEHVQMPPAPKLEGLWNVSAAATMTAWSGPWGTSFTANLTPDRETGLGTWTEDNFVQTIRRGRHLGSGRPILPPMPIPVYSQMNDEDLKSIFAYLQTIPAVKNRVPQPLPPVAQAL
jgi:mono/diheme cytochrome c family protein